MGTTRIIVCGEGGQGALSIAKIIGEAAWLQGLPAVTVPYFSTEKRGGTSMAFVTVSDKPILYPKFRKADLWVVLSQRSIDRIYDYLHEGSTVIVNSSLVKDTSRIAAWKPIGVDATVIAKQQLKKPRTFNMVVMGAMLRHIPGMDRASFDKALEMTFGKKYEKDASLRDLNKKAFDIGYDLADVVIPRLDRGIQK
jgi:2-oxoglutarate ferredoxin oxidoreductase subunit gamma